MVARLVNGPVISAIGEWAGPTSSSVPLTNRPAHCWLGRIAEWVRTAVLPNKKIYKKYGSAGNCTQIPCPLPLASRYLHSKCHTIRPLHLLWFRGASYSLVMLLVPSPALPRQSVRSQTYGFVHWLLSSNHWGKGAWEQRNYTNLLGQAYRQSDLEWPLAR